MQLRFTRRISVVAGGFAVLAVAGLGSGAAVAAGSPSAVLSITAPATVAGGTTFTASPHALVSNIQINVAEVDLSYSTSQLAYLAVNNTGSQLPQTFLSSGGSGHTQYVGAIFGPSGVSGDVLVDNTSFRAGCTAATAKLLYLPTTGVAGIVNGEGGQTVPTTEKTASVNITAAPSTVACASPSLAGATATGRAITVYGSRFGAGTTVSFGSGITVTQTQISSSTALVATVSVASSAALGDRGITVTRADHSTLSCSACFTVEPKPTLTSLSPAGIAHGTSASVTPTGTNLQYGATVSVSGSGVTATTLNGTTTVTATSGAAPGVRNVTIKNTDGGTATCTGCLTVS